jgi:hypothetical protein
MKAIYLGHAALGLLAIAAVSCSHNTDHVSAVAKEPRVAHEPKLTDQGRTEERRAEERRQEERRQGREPTYVGGGPPDPSSAVAKIASAMCEREVRCNNVGTGAKEKYSSRADCVLIMQDDKRDDINEKDCPGGVDHQQLNACLAAIREEACGNAIDTINRLASCRSGSICLK